MLPGCKLEVGSIVLLTLLQFLLRFGTRAVGWRTPRRRRGRASGRETTRTRWTGETIRKTP